MRKFQSFLAHKRRTAGIALSLLLAAGLLCVPGMTAYAEESAPLNLGNPVSLQVTPGSVEQIEDLRTANLVVDVYQIASARKPDNYDTYELEYANGFTDEALGLAELGVSGINANNIDYTTWQKIADNAAKSILGESAVPALASSKVVNAFQVFDNAGNFNIIPLPANTADPATNGGLYLVVPRSGNLEEYVKTLDDGSLATIAHSTMLEYSFAPMLVAAPSKSLSNETYGTFDTSDTSPWIYQVPVSFKTEQEPLISQFRIKKAIDKFETTDPVTFVFQIEGTFRGEKVLSTTRSFVFDENTDYEQLIDITGVKVGTLVEVTEVYAGANYEQSEAHIYNKEGTEITAENALVEAFVADTPDKVLTFSFVNTYDGKTNEGGSVINKFEDDADTWVLQKDEREYNQRGKE